MTKNSVQKNKETREEIVERKRFDLLSSLHQAYVNGIIVASYVATWTIQAIANYTLPLPCTLPPPSLPVQSCLIYTLISVYVQSSHLPIDSFNFPCFHYQKGCITMDNCIIHDSFNSLVQLNVLISLHVLGAHNSTSDKGY